MDSIVSGICLVLNSVELIVCGTLRTWSFLERLPRIGQTGDFGAVQK
jgi:hypothetical protein